MGGAMVRRNLILISFDTLRFDALSAAPDRRLLGEDASLAQTPTLDRIAGEGTFFARAVTTAPYTSTSHASIFTGTYWPKHGVMDLFDCPMRAEAEPLAAALRERRYRTAQNAGRGRSRGDMFELDRVGLNRGYESHAFGGWLKRRTLRWLRDAIGSGPWYLFFHTMAVHRPYGRSHRKFRALVRRDIAEGKPFERVRRLYLRNVSDVDRRFGHLWERLREAGALDETLVVILSDHGEGLSVHGSVHCNPGGWQEGICRVPMIFWCPGLVKAGQVIEEPISTVDVAPTIAQLLDMGWGPSLGFDGVSAARVVTGEQPASTLRGRECFFFATMGRGGTQPPIMQGLVKGATKYVSFAHVQEEQWQRLRGKWLDASRSRKKQSRCYNMEQLLKRHERGELELLLDVVTDPGEMRNLAQERPALLDELRSAMERWLRENRAEAAAVLPPPGEAVGKDTLRRLKQLGYLD